MTSPTDKEPTRPPDENRNDPRFVQYYERESATERAETRALGIMAAVLRARAREGLATEQLQVADIGCNAGTQSRCWLERGHTVRGLDISRDLVALAQRRNAEFGERARFEVGSATAVPWDSASFDVCLLPELLEHVDDWMSCVREGVRLLKHGGSIYLSTTNVLCPVQQEFTLPAYSWYPAPLKRHFVRLSTSTRPDLVNFASYPALHWFSPYQLARFLRDLGAVSRDRFDLIDVDNKGAAARFLVGAVRALPPLRFIAHVLTPSTVLVAHKIRDA